MMEVLDMDLDYDLTRICRSCCRGDDQELHPIFDSTTLVGQNGDTTLYEMLSICTQLQINCNDGMPPNVCSVCVADINAAYSFRKRSEQSDMLLREYLSRKKIEIDDDMEGENEVKEEPLDIKPDIDEDSLIGEKCFVAALPMASLDQSDEMLEEEECSDVEDDESDDGEASLGELIKKVEPKGKRRCQGYSAIEGGHFRCDSCKRVFLDKRGISSHLRRNKSKEFSSNMPKRYSGYSTINGENFKCDSCNMNFSNQDAIRKHVRQHKPKEKIHECTLCSRTYRGKFSFTRHMKNHENATIQCDQCEVKFCTHIDYRKHMVLKHSSIPIQVQQKDGKPYQTCIQMAQMAKEQYKMEAICKICDATFDRIVELRNHLETHVDPETFADVDIQTKPYLFEDGCVPENYQDFIVQQVLKGDVHRFWQIVQPDGEELELSDSDSEPEAEEDPPLEGIVRRNHVCALCNQSFPRIKAIVEHAKANHRPEDLIGCRHCSRGFPNNALLMRHLRQQCENNSKKIFCSFCNEKFMWQTSLNKHAQSKHKPTKPLFENPEPPAIAAEEDKKFVCQVCQKAFIRLDYLERHVKTHLPREKKFECPQCHKILSRKSALQGHMKTHEPNKELNHLCVYCGRGFGNSSNLKVHMRRHTGELPFKCDICDKGFPILYGLQCHRRTHTGEKPCICTICGRGFYADTNLARHMATHTGARPHQCTVCNRAYGQLKDLTVHLRRHTGEKPFQCGVCNERFVEATGLRRHRQAKGHFEEPEDGKPVKKTRKKLLAVTTTETDTIETL